MISPLFRSRYTELYGIVFGVFLVLALWGSSAEGQTSSVDQLVRRYTTEVALSFDFPHHAPSRQLADIDSIFSGTGGDGSVISPTPSLDAMTVRDSALAAIAPPDDAYLDGLSAQRSQVTEYEVQPGDLLSFIASDFGVSVNTIIWANKLKDADSISPGMILRIPPVTGVVHKVVSGDTVATLAKKYAAKEEDIIAYNRLPQDGQLEAGEEIIIRDGKMPYTAAVAVTGTASGSRLAASAAQFSHLPNLGGYFQIPTTGFNWGRIHGRNGVDIANSCGTPVYAAADGTVAIADADGYNGGFGKYIKLIHANGTETLYAHSSKLLVGVGQVVGKGQKIMLMGTTGRSTGCHLHFEVHGAKNPLAK